MESNLHELVSAAWGGVERTCIVREFEERSGKTGAYFLYFVHPGYNEYQEARQSLFAASQKDLSHG